MNASVTGRILKSACNLLAGLMLLIMCAPASTQSTSLLPVEMLDGRKVMMPNGLPGRPVLLLVGFTRESSADVSAWYRSVGKDAVIADAVEIYQVVVLEDVPKLFRNFAINSIRKDVPEKMHGHFALVTEQSAGWKSLVSYANANSPYVLLLDKKRNIVWRSDVAVDRASLQALRSEVENMRNLP